MVMNKSLNKEKKKKYINNIDIIIKAFQLLDAHMDQ